MKCGICHKPLKKGNWNKHHYWFPKANFVNRSEGRITTPLHIIYHRRFHYDFLHDCLATGMNTDKCEACEYLDICCYAVAHME